MQITKVSRTHPSATQVSGFGRPICRSWMRLSGNPVVKLRQAIRLYSSANSKSLSFCRKNQSVNSERHKFSAVNVTEWVVLAASALNTEHLTKNSLFSFYQHNWINTGKSLLCPLAPLEKTHTFDQRLIAHIKLHSLMVGLQPSLRVTTLYIFSSSDYFPTFTNIIIYSIPWFFPGCSR